MNDTLAQAHIDQVNAYADYLIGDYITRDHQQFPTRNHDVVALRNAAMAVMEMVQDWRTIAKTDDQHVTLESPDGLRILYTYEDGAERLTMIQ